MLFRSSERLSVHFKWPQVQAASFGNETWVGGVDKEVPISGEDPAGTCFLVQLVYAYGRYYSCAK